MNPYSNFSQDLKELLVSEVSLKQLKLQYPGYENLLDKASNEVENKYLLFFAKKSKSFAKENNVDPAVMFYDLVDACQRFEAVSKNGKLDALIKKGNANQAQKDINKWVNNPLYELFEFIQKAEDTITDTEKRKLAKSVSEKIYEDERFTIIKPQSYEASCYFGAGTKWCISGKTSAHYKNYVEQGYEFLFVIDKKPIEPNWEKVAVAFRPEGINDWDTVEIFDAKDNPLSLGHFENGTYAWPIVEKHIKQRWKEEDEKNQELIPIKEGDRIKWSDFALQGLEDMEEREKVSRYRGTIEDLKIYNADQWVFTVRWDSGKSGTFDNSYFSGRASVFEKVE